MSLFTTAFRPGQHHSRAMQPPGIATQLRYLAQHGPWRHRPFPKATLPTAKVLDRLPILPRSQVAVTWVGHATFAIQMEGKTILTDPVWSNGITGGLRRLAPPGISWHGLPPIDAVVISHNHFDHLDRSTLQRLPLDTPIFVPQGLGAWFRKRGFTRVSELDWWEHAQLDGLQLECVPAHHWSRRTLWDTNHALWGGWILGDTQGRKVYFAGDTAYGEAFREIGERHPGIDVALMPIGAYAPKWYNGWAHLDPGEAVRAFLDLGAAHMFPMHYGAFRLSPDTPSEALGWVRQAWAETGLARDRLWAHPPGLRRALDVPHARPPRPAARPAKATEPPFPAMAPHLNRSMNHAREAI